MRGILRNLCILGIVWGLIWTAIGILYINNVGISALFRDRRYTFVITKDGILRSIRSVADLMTLEIQREFLYQDTVSSIIPGPLRIGGRKTTINFVVLYKLGFDISKLEKRDIEVGFRGDTMVISALMPEPKVDISIQKWWVVSEELGIFGTPMRSYEASPVFDSMMAYARKEMRKEMEIWNRQLIESTQAVLSDLFTSVLGRYTEFKIKGLKSLQP